MTRSTPSDAPQRGHPSPATTVWRSTKRHAKSCPGTTPRRWTPSRLAPTTYRPEPSASSASTGTRAPTGPTLPGGAPRTCGHLVGVGGPDLLTNRAGQLALVQGVVAPHEGEDWSGRLRHEQEGLDGEPRVDPEQGRHLGDGSRVGRGDFFASPGGEVRGRGVALGELDVGAVSALGAEGHLVLAGRAGRHELVGSEPTHHPGIRLHHVVPEAAAIEDAPVGALVRGVGALERGLVGIERV